MWRGMLSDIKERKHYFWLWKICIQFPLGNIVIGKLGLEPLCYLALHFKLAPWKEGCRPVCSLERNEGQSGPSGSRSSFSAQFCLKSPQFPQWGHKNFHCNDI